MIFKNEGLKDELAKTSVQLQVMGEHLDQLAVAHFGKHVVLTRVFEAVAGSSGVHEAGRALDFRQEHNGKNEFTPEQERFLVSEMNRRFPRTDNKLTCMVHSFKGGMRHFHVQNNPNVTRDADEDPSCPDLSC